MGTSRNFSDFPTYQDLARGWYPLRVSEREQVRAEDGNEPLRFVRYLLKFIAGFLAVSIPLFALVALFLRISPARLIAPFLLILATSFLVGPLVYFAGKNKERPIVFSLFISLGVGIYLLVFQLVVIYFGTEFGLIGEGFRGTWIPVALLVSVIVPAIIFFRIKQRIESRPRNVPG
jgi:hypothetical protein